MLIAQISDLHMCEPNRPMSGRIETGPFIAAAVDAINAFTPRPDLVVVTGDLTDCGLEEEYRLLKSELDRFAMSYYLIPGNHDRRDTLRSAFADHAYLPAEGPLNWVIDDRPVRLVGVDAIVPGKSHGELSDKTLAWLRNVLQNDDKPVIITIHHPPFPTGIASMDEIGCLNGEAMAELLADHNHVERVIAGHHHRAIQIRWAGTIGSVCPSVAHQVMLDLDDRSATRFVMEPPAYQLHFWQQQTGVISHTAYIEKADGPFDFALPSEYPGH